MTRLLLTAEDLTLWPKGRSAPLFKGLRLDLSSGASLRIAGRSGAGKTALLRFVAGLESPVSGKCSIAGTLRIGFAFAEPRLLPDLDAFANIALVLREDRGSFVTHALQTLGLAEVANTPARLLSKGQAQRVALLRAVAIRPDLLLLDEAGSGLDPATWNRTADFLRSRRQEQPFGLIEISHAGHQLLDPAAQTLVLDTPDTPLGV